MSSLPSNSKGGNRASWTPAQDAFVVDFLAKQCSLGRFSDNGFKKEIWRKATEELNKKFNVSVTVQQLKSHMADLKARYRIVKALREQSGFGWDDLIQICIADEDVWNRYIQEDINEPDDDYSTDERR
ncbi:hypothetical protein MRB53_030365 [Persea americana]|uniref:Uncharacterized protein n=1 Tax=Persea americana TaxID=3435 RepID=A0ACC2KL28_PERAE|nr:hypothetical protein MRB53_030365 [Persea americana]